MSVTIALLAMAAFAIVVAVLLYVVNWVMFPEVSMRELRKRASLSKFDF